MRRAAATGSVLLVAVLATLLNAPKPLHIDDTANYYYARQAAARPLDPYGFDIFWYERPEPANEVLNPLGLPYWWSLALRVSDEPVLWKLWLLPFVLCLTWSLYALFRRFTPLTLPSPPSGGEGRVRGKAGADAAWRRTRTGRTCSNYKRHRGQREETDNGVCVS